MDRFIKYTPIIYGSLVFIGFLNYYFFYMFFSIDISEYLTTWELLLSFLKLTIPMVLVLSILAYFFLSVVVREIFEKDLSEKLENEESEIHHVFPIEFFRELYKEIKSFSYKKPRDYLFVLLSLIVFVITTAGFLFAIGFLFYIIYQVVGKDLKYISAGSTIFYGLIWLLIIDTFLKKLERRRNKKYNWISYYLAIILFLALLFISNKEKALNILKGKSNYEVILYQSSDTIITDTTLLYLGKTDRYIFLWNNRDSTSVAINTNNISRIEMRAKQK